MIYTYNGDSTTAKTPKQILEEMLSALMDLNDKLSKCHTNIANIEIMHYHMYGDGTSEDDININTELAAMNSSIGIYFDLYNEKINQFKMALAKLIDDNNLLYKADKMVDIAYPYLDKILNNYIPTDNNATNIEQYMNIMNDLEEKLHDECNQSDIYVKIVCPKCIEPCLCTQDFENILKPHFSKLQIGIEFNPDMEIQDIKDVVYIIKRIYNHVLDHNNIGNNPEAKDTISMIKFINTVGLFRHFLYSMMLAFVINWNDTFDILEDR